MKMTWGVSFGADIRQYHPMPVLEGIARRRRHFQEAVPAGFPAG